MTPNTDAEIIAWNLGRELARNGWATQPIFEATPLHDGIALTPARAQARDLLGPELFWGWADRGYNAERSVPTR